VTLRPAPKAKMVAKAPKKRVPRVNARRAAVRRARDFGEIGDWLATQPCFICGKRTGEWTMTLVSPMGAACVKVVSAHVKSRGSGGRKHANQIPLAWHIHQLQEVHGWERIGMTLEKAREVAQEYQRLFDAQFAGPAESLAPKKG
jgi:hypothetical protein